MEKIKYNRLSEVLKELGWSQKKLADVLEVKHQTVQQICSNARQMSMERLYEIANILGVNVCELLVDNMPEETTD